MKIKNPNYREKIAEIFRIAPFIQELGVELKDLGPGWCETELTVQSKHLQQNGFVHAGVLATMADHTAGGAGGSLLAETDLMLTSGFTIHFLRPGIGEKLKCRSEVIKAGKALILAESSVFAVSGDVEKLVSKASISLSLAAGK